jgi:UMF1 family MFS transporter
MSIATEGQSPIPAALVAPPARPRLSAWAWALFQGVRDPYVMLITIYVFAPYFVSTVVGDPVRGQALVASGAKYAGWIVMFTAPLLGAAVDRMGPRKPWLGVTVALMAPLIALLWFTAPGGAGLGIAGTVAVLAAVGVLFAYTETLHNALLVPAVGMARVGATSGLGLALGNFISVTMLIFVLWGFALPGKVPAGVIPAAPLFGLDAATHEPDRVVALLVAAAFVIGALPLFLFVRDVPRTGVKLLAALRLGASDLKALVMQARGHRDALTYLGARMLFTDGLTGILIFAGIYASGAMGWASLQLLAYGILLSMFSVVGGLSAGWLDGKLGPKLALKLEIVGVVVSQLLSLGNTRDLFFFQPYVAGTPVWDGPIFKTAPELGLLACGFVGAVTVTAAYSSSRTLLTRVVPPEKVGVFFGLFVIAGTATMWLGPLLVQLATDLSGSQRVGLLPLSGLLVAGLIVLQFVRGGERKSF